MPERDEFPLSVRTALAQRAGYKCSFPTCRRPTVGPSNESPSSSASVGMACHIAAAGGPRARRYDQNLTSEERRSIENGIYMCSTHGNLIDKDEEIFSVDMLKKWREIAERRAEFEMHHNMELDLRDFCFAVETISIELENYTNNELIGDALQNTCVSSIWGKEITEAVRDTLIELSRNAVEHGRATAVELFIEDKRLRLLDNGEIFDAWNLIDRIGHGGGGGTTAFNHLVNHGAPIVVSSRRHEDLNETVFSVANQVQDILNATPCHLLISAWQNRQPPCDIDITSVQSCNTIYLILPRFAVFSDVRGLVETLKRIMSDGRRYVLVSNEHSTMVRSRLADDFPDVRLLAI